MRPLSSLFILLFAVVCPFIASAHIGSSGVIVQKQVGKYQLLVSIQPPDVVPGTAKVSVFVEKGNPTSIQGRPVYFFEGDEGAPEADPLTSVGTNRFEGSIWLMESGSTSIQLSLSGPDGNVDVVVPVLATSTATRDMPAGTGAGLAVMGLLLLVMMITIIGASNSDGVLAPGLPKARSFQRRRLIGMAVGGVVLVLVLTGGRMWWNSWADEYRTYQLYKAPPLISTAKPENGQVVLTMQPDTTGFSGNWRRSRDFNLMVLDHGKLMHTFMVRLPNMDAFAHLHPTRRDSLHFITRLPNLPGGKYLLFTDVVYRSGYAETLTDTVDVPSVKVSAEQAAQRTIDPDDSFLIAQPIGSQPENAGTLTLDKDMASCGKPGASARLADGSTMIWTDKPAAILDAGQLYTLKFAVADPSGKATKLEPYLGMSGHAAILRSDGSVYIHLHPVGTYSMASESLLVNRIADTARVVPRLNGARFRDSIDTYLARLKTQSASAQYAALAPEMTGMNHTQTTNNMVTFPYAFPKAGTYRIWVQVKRNGNVLTGSFDTQVR
ncbi:hypothetical protein [Fibrella forsythiae]|uniref:hypothetical protein n=1 Tax=Fibrella forsythiae TaxID=2817061 RepID=UPI001E2BAB7A|nr:hypothetical protein [Fibrella forsythiae]